MVSIWTAHREGNIITLNDGRVIDMDSFPGNGWTENRCRNITENVQRNLIDVVIDRDTLPIDDPDRTATEEELQNHYGIHFIELNTQGNSNEIRLRYVDFYMYPSGDSFEVGWGNRGTNWNGNPK